MKTKTKLNYKQWLKRSEIMNYNNQKESDKKKILITKTKLKCS